MSNHTATPWKISDVGAGFEIDDALDRPVAQVFERYSKSNEDRRKIAAHIVRCVNSHGALLEALSQIVDALPTRRDWLDPVLEKIARAALAAAKGDA